ncbi:MAG: tRNA (uridine(34)/cytosine(34)/5-carboxymethylaminomethyluridine(34)-2'-O)-methyltransferase TrmL [Gammaproteobacteria bacterium]|nr:tRNA (uridine(34)/cytosine(34)/5-carboxymethylaminomethyluridine(34)-2'-O)-methyltransferase TrmL [Gammaproteobacteria bacterium]MDH5800265.1 tRNA (uridine(34)/cytosine(34)/5-carboxymethylaminomethyluridine(34)-2'-O)-methyltransferase TrmL [Gammaproteobacteria bacterium]
MFNVVLYEPEIPHNTGAIIRLCANCGSQLHLVQPLGFTLSDKHLKRAGLDYHEFANIQVHDNVQACFAAIGETTVYALSTKGKTQYADARFQSGDTLLFGPETRGLPESLLHSLKETQVLRIPMRPNSRSINLANAASVVVYEAWRQNEFKSL